MDNTHLWVEAHAYFCQWLPAEVADLLSGPDVSLLGGDSGQYQLFAPADIAELITPRVRTSLNQALRLASGHTDAKLKIVATAAKPATPRHRLQLTSAYTILTTQWPEPRYAVGEILPAGLTLFAGRQKIGKSWLAMQVALSIITGQPFLGQFPVEPGKFLYLALEDNENRLKSRMSKQGWLPHLDQLTGSGFVMPYQFIDQIGHLDEEGAGILADQIDAQQPRLVIIDVLGRAVRGNPNDYDVMTDALGPIQRVALEANCAVQIIDHHNKRSSYVDEDSADPIIDVIGSGAKTGVPDTIWGIYKKRGSDRVRLNCIGRDVEDRQLLLRMDAAAGLWLLDKDAADLEITPRRQEILNVITGMGQATVSDVAAATEQNRGNAYTRLQDLVDAGLVTRTHTPGHADSYSLTGSTPDGQ